MLTTSSMEADDIEDAAGADDAWQVHADYELNGDHFCIKGLLSDRYL